MLSSGLLKQIKSLQESMKESIDYFDVNYKGINKRGSIAVRGLPCVLQKYKLWLMSSAYDYHRKPAYGGFLEKYVTKSALTEANERYIKSQLVLETEKNFPDIRLLKCIVKADIAQRRWEITVVPQDKRSGLIDNSMISEDGTSIVCYPDL